MAVEPLAFAACARSIVAVHIQCERQGGCQRENQYDFIGMVDNFNKINMIHVQPISIRTKANMRK